MNNKLLATVTAALLATLGTSGGIAFAKAEPSTEAPANTQTEQAAEAAKENSLLTGKVLGKEGNSLIVDTQNGNIKIITTSETGFISVVATDEQQSMEKIEKNKFEKDDEVFAIIGENGTAVLVEKTDIDLHVYENIVANSPKA